MAKLISLSPLTINPNSCDEYLLAGPWCINRINVINASVQKDDPKFLSERMLPKQQFLAEAEECFRLYKKYSVELAEQLNLLHGTSYSLRYWETLLNRFMYHLTATVVDKYAVLESLKRVEPNSNVCIVNYKKQWINPHFSSSFGSSRMLHLLVYSVIVATSKIFAYQEVPDEKILEQLNLQGDGKKDIRSREKKPKKNFQVLVNGANYLSIIRTLIRAIKRLELPIKFAKYLNPKVISLGGQYLMKYDFLYLMMKSNTAPVYFNSSGLDELEYLLPDENRRSSIMFSNPESELEKSLQECIRHFLPTVFFENYNSTKGVVQKLLPKSPKVILNSQNHSGGELIDFFIAHTVEERKAKHLMICHGGCYGAMEVSIQEKIWARISDSYALWSNPISYGPNCKTVKLPSLRFHKWQSFYKKPSLGKNILMMLTGNYPQRYAYNSIYPYTIDDQYDEWQIQFLSKIEKKLQADVVIRDFHHSFDNGLGRVCAWAEKSGIKVDSDLPLDIALCQSKIVVHTVAQTTYLETLSANHPTICFWNPDSNLIRSDLMPYFDGLVAAGVIHHTPESAAEKLNEVADDPLTWWSSDLVRDAVSRFMKNVCYTSPDGLSKWAAYIRNMEVE